MRDATLGMGLWGSLQGMRGAMDTCKALESWLQASLTEKQWRHGHLTILLLLLSLLLLLLLSLLLLLRLLLCHMAGQHLRGQACRTECP